MVIGADSDDVIGLEKIQKGTWGETNGNREVIASHIDQIAGVEVVFHIDRIHQTLRVQ